MDTKPSLAGLHLGSRQAAGATGTGVKRKREPEEVPADAGAAPQQPTGLWQVSQNEFSRQFRFGNICIDAVLCWDLVCGHQCCKSYWPCIC